MFNIVLVEPEIPPNTGNVIRLAANTGCHLHLVGPLGFVLDDARLRRAGLDYHEWVNIRQHASLAAALEFCAPGTPYAFSTHGQGVWAQCRFNPGDVLVFGRETAGLSSAQLELFAPQNKIRLPMLAQQRSLNLSNAVAVAVYEAWRQCDYAGAGQ